MARAIVGENGELSIVSINAPALGKPMRTNVGWQGDYSICQKLGYPGVSMMYPFIIKMRHLFALTLMPLRYGCLMLPGRMN